MSADLLLKFDHDADADESLLIDWSYLSYKVWFGFSVIKLF